MPRTWATGFTLARALLPCQNSFCSRFMPDSTHTSLSHGAVFLSYASQDAEAAKRICEALHGAGIEVWFDQSQLRGGDAWDQSIRRQIKECALFMPVISANTQARTEGYFRREWKLAVERTHDMADHVAFLLPVVLDVTTDREAHVPDKFRDVQWTRLPGGETPPAFAERVKKLLGGAASGPRQSSPATSHSTSTPPTAKPSRHWLLLTVIGLVVTLIIVFMLRPHRSPKEVADLVALAQTFPEPKAVPISEARQLVRRAGVIWEDIHELSSESLGAAEELYTRALALDPTDAEVWAAASRLDAWMVFMGYDPTDERRQKAQKEATRAVSLAPNSVAARHAQACVLAFAFRSAATLSDAEKTYRTLALESPDNKALIEELGIILRDEGHNEEATALYEKHGLLEDAGWNYFVAGKFDEAGRIAEHLLSQRRTAGALFLKFVVELEGFEDLAAAQTAVRQFTSAELLSDSPAMAAAIIAIYSREPDEAIRVLNALPHEYLATFNYNGPKRALSGFAHERAGRAEAAHAEWRIALQQVQERLKAKPNDLALLSIEAELLACLGDTEEAGRTLQLFQSLTGPDANSDWAYLSGEGPTLLRIGRKEEVLAKLTSALNTRVKHLVFLHPYVRFDPEYDPLRGDPRFEKLLRDTLPPGAKPFDESAAKPAPAPELGR